MGILEYGRFVSLSEEVTKLTDKKTEGVSEVIRRQDLHSYS